MQAALIDRKKLRENTQLGKRQTPSKTQTDGRTDGRRDAHFVCPSVRPSLRRSLTLNPTNQTQTYCTSARLFMKQELVGEWVRFNYAPPDTTFSQLSSRCYCYCYCYCMASERRSFSRYCRSFFVTFARRHQIDAVGLINVHAPSKTVCVTKGWGGRTSHLFGGG